MSIEVQVVSDDDSESARIARNLMNAIGSDIVNGARLSAGQAPAVGVSQRAGADNDPGVPGRPTLGPGDAGLGRGPASPAHLGPGQRRAGPIGLMYCDLSPGPVLVF